MAIPASPPPQDPHVDDVQAAVRLLRRGGVVAVPTDTLYGLAASAFDVRAVERVYRIKGRAEGIALPLLLAESQDLELCAVDVPQIAWTLAGHFWPGPLTLVLRRSGNVPDAVTGGMDTVAVRVPDHPVPRAIVRGLGTPITGTSANRSGGPAPTTAAVVMEQLGGEIDRVIDLGECPGRVASTILDVTGSVPRVVRHGAVGVRQIEEVAGRPVARAR